MYIQAAQNYFGFGYSHDEKISTQAQMKMRKHELQHKHLVEGISFVKSAKFAQ